MIIRIRGTIIMAKPRFFLTPAEYLSAHGRISRLQYFVHGLIVAAVLIAIFAALGMTGMVDDTVDPLLWSLIYAVAMLGFTYLLVCLYAKRLHDLGWSGFWCLLALFDVPIDVAVTLTEAFTPLPEAVTSTNTAIGMIGNITGMGLGLVLTFKAGDRGRNKYGADPLKAPEPDTSVF